MLAHATARFTSPLFLVHASVPFLVSSTSPAHAALAVSSSDPVLGPPPHVCQRWGVHQLGTQRQQQRQRQLQYQQSAVSACLRVLAWWAGQQQHHHHHQQPRRESVWPHRHDARRGGRHHPPQQCVAGEVLVEGQGAALQHCGRVWSGCWACETWDEPNAPSHVPVAPPRAVFDAGHSFKTVRKRRPPPRHTPPVRYHGCERTQHTHTHTIACTPFPLRAARVTAAPHLPMGGGARRQRATTVAERW